MPRLVRTPEQVLRETKQEFYFIEFFDQSSFDSRLEAYFCPIEKIAGRRELFAWFEREQPHVELEDLGPPENSGFIEGGIGILVRVAFDDASLAKYVATWENEDGSSKDPRWTCYIYPYKEEP